MSLRARRVWHQSAQPGSRLQHVMFVGHAAAVGVSHGTHPHNTKEDQAYQQGMTSLQSMLDMWHKMVNDELTAQYKVEVQSEMEWQIQQSGARKIEALKASIANVKKTIGALIPNGERYQYILSHYRGSVENMLAEIVSNDGGEDTPEGRRVEGNASFFPGEKSLVLSEILRSRR